MAIAAIIFDLDGVLVDSEAVWDAARREVALEYGGTWPDDAQRVMMGMSSTEWAAYLHDELGVALSPEQISQTVVSRMESLYNERLPLLPGARETVIGLRDAWPLGLASSSNRELIDRALDVSGLASLFRATVSSEEVARGKPAPDVYFEAARRLDVEPRRCAAIEDSANGIRSAHAAGMRVIAIPNAAFPPPADVLELAHAVLRSVSGLTPDAVEPGSSRPEQ